MQLGCISSLPMGLNKTCSCRSDHWTRNISALCHHCGGHIHPSEASSLTDKAIEELGTLYEITPIAYNMEVPIHRSLSVMYGLEPRDHAKKYQITHSGSRPYRYDKKSPVKIGVIYSGLHRRYSNESNLENKVKAFKTLVHLNSAAYATHAHNGLFAFTPQLERPETRIYTAPATFNIQALAWQSLTPAWSKGSYQFVFDRRDFTPSLLAKFLAFWNTAVSRNSPEVFHSGETIGRQLIDNIITDTDYCANAASIPYIDQSKGITHRSLVPYTFSRTIGLHDLMNRNHFSLKLLDQSKAHLFSVVLQMIECSMYYLLDVSMRCAAIRTIDDMTMWCMEQPDRMEADSDYMHWVS